MISRLGKGGEPRKGAFRLLKEERLRTDREYGEVVRKGERTRTRHFTIYRDFAGGEGRKIGVSVGKRVGKALVRNRIKRVLREFYRFNKGLFPGGSRTAIVVREAPARPCLAGVAEELLPAFFRRWGEKKEGPVSCGRESSSSRP